MGVGANGFAPEGLCRQIGSLLRHAPLPWKQAKEPLRCLLPNVPAAEFTQDKKLGQRAGNDAINRFECAHQGKPRQFAGDTDQERESPWFYPILVQVVVTEQPMLIYVLLIEFAVIVLAQFQEIAKNELIGQRRGLYGNLAQQGRRLTM